MAAATGSCGGEEAQPATSASATVAAMADNGSLVAIGKEARLAWVFLEIIAALAIAVAIVWWTIPKKGRNGDKGGDGPR
jgi:hypothetical protein